MLCAVSNSLGRTESAILLCSTYYKPVGDLLYISSEQGGGLIICTELIYKYTVYKRPIPIQELRAEEGGL